MIFHAEYANNNPFEAYPVWVDESYNNYHYGNGDFALSLSDTPVTWSETWSETWDTKITFLRTETVTVPAGTFDCVVVFVRTDIDDSLDMDSFSEDTFYVCPEVGAVKSESYFWFWDPTENKSYVDRSTDELIWTSIPSSIAKDMSSIDFGEASASEVFQVWNDGVGTLDYSVSITGGGDYFSVSPLSGSSIGVNDKNTHTIMLDRSGIALGEVVTGEVRISSSQADDSPHVIQLSATRDTFSDLTNDKVVSFDDLGVLLDYWMDQCSGPDWCGGADFDHSYRVDSSDFARLGESWLIDRSLVAHWTMDDNAADTLVFDSSYYGNDGIAGQNTANITTAGKVNDALSFNGSSDMINLGTPAGLENLPLADFSIAVWVFCEDGSASVKDGIFHAFNDNGWLFETRTNAAGERQLQFYIATSANATNSKSAYGSMSNNTWHHVVGVYQATTKSATLYIDGVEPSYHQAVAGTGNYLSDAANEKEIGVCYIGDVHKDFFTGKIDEMKIFDKALTPEDVLALYSESN
jgi:hypothetical protein